jgi:hypothetical protein
MTRLVRTRGGAVVHLEACTAITTNAKPWEWAEDRTDDEIRRSLAMIGSRACTVCKPMAEGR